MRQPLDRLVAADRLGDPEALGEQEDERGVDIVDALPELRKRLVGHRWRSEEHTSELQSLMRISYAVFCLKKKKTQLVKELRDLNYKTYVHITTVVHNIEP